tara:strand:- start:21077 stop:22165 length:1089 start_codon:yes stop_codon:yes gene_type:complete
MTNHLSIDEINKALLARESEYPFRKKYWQRFLDTTQSFANECIEKSIDFKIDFDRIEKSSSVTNNQVFICGSMKSGTSLIQSLLDNHRDMLVLPGDTHMVNKHLNSENEIEFFIDMWVRKLVSPRGRTPFWYLGMEKDPYIEFSSYFRKIASENIHSGDLSIFNSIVHAISCVQNRDTKTFVEKTPENEFRIKDILKSYPSAKFIHIIRSPIDNLCSMKSLTNKMFDENFNVNHVANSIKNSFIMSHNNSKLLGFNRYHVIKYENLISDLENTMISVSKFLGIDYNEILTTPSEGGKPSVSNSMFEDRKSSGKVLDSETKEKRIERIKSTLTREELEAAIWHLADLYSHFGYNPMEIKDLLQ